jgi:flagella basal body P-ring formation protein FlgA
MPLLTAMLGWMPVGASQLSDSAPGDASPWVAAARTRLLGELQHARPDIRRFELKVIGHPSVPRSAEAGPSVAIHGAALSPRQCVWVSLGRGGRAAGSIPVWFSVKAFRPVLVSQRSRAARSRVESDDFTVDERDVAMLDGVPLEMEADIAQLRSRRAIAAGHIIMKADLEPMPPVSRGQEVSVEVHYGSVAIETSAVALREGRVGESVMVRNPDSRLTYAAQVVGPGRAMVVDP